MNSINVADEFLLIETIQVRLALTLDDDRRTAVVRMVEEMTASREIRDARNLIAELTQQPTSHRLWQNFVRIATIGETYFFRDQAQMNALQYSVLPGLIEERRKRGWLQLRIWSAGCSSGEEPYSLAIMLREMLPDYSLWDIRILATDLNGTSLKRANDGLYRSWSFRGETPLILRERWFTAETEGFRISPSLRQMVTFTQLNLASGSYPSLTNGTMDVDVILCRNVLIYFSNADTAQVIRRFHESLSATGWLVLGHSESAHMLSQEFEPRNFEGAVLFQKQVHAVEPENVPTTGSPRPFPASPARPGSSTGPLPARPTLRKTTAPLTSGRTTGPLPKPGTASHTGKSVPLPLAGRSPYQKSAAPTPSITLPEAVEHARRAADLEQWQEALDWLAEAEKKNRLSPEVHYLRGVVQLQQGEIDNGIHSLRQSIYCDPGFVMAHFALGEVYEKQANYKKASYEWNQAREILATLRPQDLVACGGDLTVEMLSGLVQFRLIQLPLKN